MIDQEDLALLKSRDIKLNYILGGPGSDRRNQCAKLVSEHKFVYISLADAIREEIKKKSKLGESCGDISNSLELLPTDLATAILIKAILSSKGTVRKNFY